MVSKRQHQQTRRPVGRRPAYVAAAPIHEIWPCVMPRSRPMAAVLIRAAPERKDVVAVASVAMATKPTSWAVFWKHAGRSPNLLLAAAAVSVVAPPDGRSLLFRRPASTSR